MCKNKLNWEIELVTKGLVEMNKSCIISLRKGRYKAWGESENRSSDLEFYHLRDEYRALLYSALRLLIRLREFGEVRKALKLQRVLLYSPFLRILCIDNVLSNKGGFTPGLDGKKGLSDKDLEWFMKSSITELKKLSYDVKLVWIPKENTTELRPLGISNALSKCAQELVRVLLEPILKVDVSYGETESFGSRSGKSALMAVDTLVKNLNNVLPSFIINLDISKCFDKISHEAILRESKGRMHPEMLSLLETMLNFNIVDGRSGQVRGNNGIGTPQVHI
jgi:RNA-directed DNA polymerase